MPLEMSVQWHMSQWERHIPVSMFIPQVVEGMEGSVCKSRVNICWAEGQSCLGPPSRWSLSQEFSFLTATMWVQVRAQHASLPWVLHSAEIQWLAHPNKIFLTVCDSNRRTKGGPGLWWNQCWSSKMPVSALPRVLHWNLYQFNLGKRKLFLLKSYLDSVPALAPLLSLRSLQSQATYSSASLHLK